MLMKFFLILACLSASVWAPDSTDHTEKVHEDSFHSFIPDAKLYTRSSPYRIPEIWDNIQAQAAEHEISYEAAKDYIKEMTKYLEEVKKRNLQINESVWEIVTDEMQEMEELVQQMEAPLWGWGKPKHELDTSKGQETHH